MIGLAIVCSVIFVPWQQTLRAGGGSNMHPRGQQFIERRRVAFKLDVQEGKRVAAGDPSTNQ